MTKYNKGLIVALTLGVAAIWVSNKAANAEGDLEKNIKITICHIPPGNPENAHSITISLKALEHHLAHGDTIGECDAGEDPVNDCNGDNIEDPCPCDNGLNGQLYQNGSCTDG